MTRWKGRNSESHTSLPTIVYGFAKKPADTADNRDQTYSIVLAWLSIIERQYAVTQKGNSTTCSTP